jgi:hypothetical protein
MKKAKRFLVIVPAAAVLFAGVAAGAHAQMAVTAPLMESLMAITHADQAIYYAQSIASAVENAVNTYNQFQNMLRAEERAIKNLSGVADVKSLDDFMSWYDRQLYLEKEAENRFKNMSVKVGGKKYNIDRIADLPEAMKSEYIDYWDNEFSEAQRREAWLNLGLSPANYAYVQAWEAQEKDLVKTLLVKKNIQNEENKKATERNKGMLDKIAEDKNKPEEEKMGEKELLSMLVELFADSNRVARQQAYDDAEAKEKDIVTEQKNNVPANSPDISGMWNYKFFGPISDR